MKTTSSKILITSIIVSAVMLIQISPAMAVSEKPLNIGTTSTACTRIATLKTSNEAELTTQIITMQTNFAARIAKITSDKTATDQKVATARLNAKNQFETKVTAMLSQPGLTQVQTQAINTYKINMEQAETTRQTAIDSARTQYRTSLMNTITTQQQTLTNAINAYQTAVRSAFAIATTNCGDGTALTTLKTSIKTARQTLTTARTATKTTNEVKQYATTRNDATQAANKIFTDSVATYTTTLTSALKSTTN
jgi:hypothetical protein